MYIFKNLGYYVIRSSIFSFLLFFPVSLTLLVYLYRVFYDSYSAMEKQDQFSRLGFYRCIYEVHQSRYRM